MYFLPDAVKESAMASSTVALDKRIGFLGSGQMAEALARGLIKRGLVTAERIACNDPNPVRKELFKSFGAMPYDSNADVRHGHLWAKLGTICLALVAFRAAFRSQ